jgi:tripartite-type tricarboxylate transporter receptor subunit TctC
MLAVTGAARSRVLPDVPSTTELGLSAVSASEWLVLLGPPRLPQAIVERLNSVMRNAIASPLISERFQTLGMANVPMSPSEVGAFIAAETAALSAIIRTARITAE